MTVEWHDQHNGGSGAAHALPHSDLSGFFWFFTPENIELIVKPLDGTTLNGKLWLFYGGLSDLGYTISVRDLGDGHAVRTYENPPRVICGRGDSAAFLTRICRRVAAPAADLLKPAALRRGSSSHAGRDAAPAAGRASGGLRTSGSAVAGAAGG